MKDTEYQAVEPLVDVADETFEAFLSSDAVDEVKKALEKATAHLPEGMSVTFNCTLEVYDEGRGGSLHLLDTGISGSCGIAPYRSEGATTIHRYLVEGEVCQVPHDYCPKCWGGWGFKDKNRMCPSCGVQMGKEIKNLIDSDVCPNCEEGEVTMSNPVCPKCGHEVDPEITAWG